MPDRGTSIGPNSPSTGGRQYTPEGTIKGPGGVVYGYYGQGRGTYQGDQQWTQYDKDKDYFDQQKGFLSGVKRFLGKFTGQTQLSDAMAISQWELDQNKLILEDQRLYDEPKEQVERMQQAGLNPALMYSGGGALIGSGSISAKGGTAGLESGGMPKALGMIGSVIGIGSQIQQLKGQQLNNMFNSTTLLNRVDKAISDSKTAESTADLNNIRRTIQRRLIDTDVEGNYYVMPGKKGAIRNPKYNIDNTWPSIGARSVLSKQRTDAMSSQHQEVMSGFDEDFRNTTQNMGQWIRLVTGVLNMIKYKHVSLGLITQADNKKQTK